MKYVGLVILILGVFVFLIGGVVIVSTVTSTYATDICGRATQDQKVADEAKQRCRDVSSDCYKEATRTLTTSSDCENAKSFMNRQLIMGIVPAVLGGLMFVLGLAIFIFFMFRRKRAPAAI